MEPCASIGLDAYVPAQVTISRQSPALYSQGIYQVDSGIYNGHKLQPVRYSAWDPDLGYETFAFKQAEGHGAVDAGAAASPAYEEKLYLKMEL